MKRSNEQLRSLAAHVESGGRVADWATENKVPLRTAYTWMERLARGPAEDQPALPAKTSRARHQAYIVLIPLRTLLHV